MSRCPWCGAEVPQLVMIMYLTDGYTVTERICPDCRKAWLKRLKKAVGA